MQQALSSSSTTGCGELAADFAHGVKNPSDIVANIQMTCVKTREVGSQILTEMLLKDMPLIGHSIGFVLPDDRVAEEKQLRSDSENRFYAFANSAPGPSIGRDKPKSKIRKVSIQVDNDKKTIGTVFDELGMPDVENMVRHIMAYMEREGTFVYKPSRTS